MRYRDCSTYSDPFSNGYIVSIVVIYLSYISIKQVKGSIHEYQNEGFIRRSNSYFFHGGSEGLYASKVHIDTEKPTSNEDKTLNGKSFIRFESVTFRRTKESAEKKNEMQQKTGLVEAIIVEVKDMENIGGSYLNSDAICCTPDLAKDGSCKVGEVIIHQDPDNLNGPKRIQTFFEGQNEEVNMPSESVEINSTGMYYLYFMFCDPELRGVVISGRTVWRNPEGYLPGKMAPMMTFSGLMSLAYLVLGLFWFLRFVQYWKDIIQLHYHITAVIGLGMCEMALWYFEYAIFNSTGTRPMGITLWAVTFSAVKKTVSRLLILVVSMGYGVVRPTLGGITAKVILLGVTYFVFSEALGLVEHLGNINNFSGKARLILVLPVSLLDACFIVWIFSSLSWTLEKLQIRRSMAKFALYQKFTNSLAVSVLLSIAWIGYEISKALAGAAVDRKDLMRKLPKFIYDEEKALEKTRKILAEKIAQLNSAIDDVSAQLKTEYACWSALLLGSAYCRKQSICFAARKQCIFCRKCILYDYLECTCTPWILL